MVATTAVTATVEAAPALILSGPIGWMTLAGMVSVDAVLVAAACVSAVAIVGVAVESIAASGSGGPNPPPEETYTRGPFHKAWKDLDSYRGKTKRGFTYKVKYCSKTGKELSQKDTNDCYLYEKDYTHGDVEVYDLRGIHVGSVSMEGGELTKPAVKGRSINV